jgi:hypothetical protein
MYIQADENGIKKVSGKNWRLVHDGIMVIELAEQDFDAATGGSTEIFVAKTKKECDAEIAKLKLTLLPHIAERYAQK